MIGRAGLADYLRVRADRMQMITLPPSTPCPIPSNPPSKSSWCHEVSCKVIASHPFCGAECWSTNTNWFLASRRSTTSHIMNGPHFVMRDSSLSSLYSESRTVGLLPMTCQPAVIFGRMPPARHCAWAVRRIANSPYIARHGELRMTSTDL
jgi:hypothetical protein